MITEMELLREYESLNNALRQSHNITRSTMLLDFAYGNDRQVKHDEHGKITNLGDFPHLDKELRRELAKAVEMYDLGYDMGDRLNYTLDNDFIPPVGDTWITIKKDGLWFSLNIKQPDWLKEKNRERKEKREIINNKIKNNYGK